jgi:hypothetical protein
MKIIILAFCACLFFIGCAYNNKNDITCAQIKQVKVGMSFEQVMEILGKPHEIQATRQVSHTMSCNSLRGVYNVSANSTKNIRDSIERIYKMTSFCCASDTRKEATFVYTKKAPLLGSYPMLWVHFDSTITVSSVYAKEFIPLVNHSEGMYCISRKIIDYEKGIISPTAVDYFINEEKLCSYFQ